MYSCLLEDLFDKKACEKDKKEKKKKGRTEEKKTRGKKIPKPNKKPKNGYFCGLHSNEVQAST